MTEFAEVAPDAHACKKKGVAFSKKGKSREGFSRRLLGAAELAEQKAWFDEAKQTILSARRLSQKQICRDECWLPCFGPRWHNSGKILELVLKKLCHPRIPRQVSLRKGMLRYNGITVSFVKLNSLALGLRQLAFNVC